MNIAKRIEKSANGDQMCEQKHFFFNNNVEMVRKRVVPLAVQFYWNIPFTVALLKLWPLRQLAVAH